MVNPTNGSLSMNQIHVDIGGTSGTTCSLDDADIRQVVKKSSGQTYSIGDLRGKGAVVYDDQTTQTGTIWGLNENPVFTPNQHVRLTSTTQGVMGHYYWYGTLSESWTCTFDFYTGGGPGPYGYGDCVWFYAHRSTQVPDTTNLYSNNEESTGPWYNFVFDEYDSNTIQIHGPTGGNTHPDASSGVQSQGYYLTHVSSPFDIDSSTWRTAVIEFTKGSTTNIKIYVDGTLHVNYTHTPQESLPYTTNSYFGFGSRTGGAVNDHYIRNIKIVKHISTPV